MTITIDPQKTNDGVDEVTTTATQTTLYDVAEDMPWSMRVGEVPTRLVQHGPGATSSERWSLASLLSKRLMLAVSAVVVCLVAVCRPQ